MLPFILLPIAVAIFAGVLFACPDHWRRHWDIQEGVFAFFAALLMTSIISTGMYFMVEDEKMDYTTTYELKEMQLTSKTEGHYATFLTIGGGSFGEKGYYYFYAKSPDGSITLGKVEGSQMVFHEIGANDKAYFKCRTHEANQRYDADLVDYRIDNCEFFIPVGKINDDVDVHLKGNV